MSKSRVTVTLPPELLEAADRRADELDRSRSWLLAESLRVYLSDGERSGLVREPRSEYSLGLGPTRQAQLEADLALSPEERVLLAEETARVAELRGPITVHDRVILFGRHEDFLVWEKLEALGG